MFRVNMYVCILHIHNKKFQNLHPLTGSLKCTMLPLQPKMDLSLYVEAKLQRFLTSSTKCL
jgi:hypothetical protein